MLRRAGIFTAIALLCALYLADLTGMGLVGPDEPRYAAVAREMARSGDWVTPRLWGQPWFEKPALLYWMTASAFRVGLGPDLAPRLPVGLLSLAFLGFFWWRVKAEWDARAAFCATAILATSAGWLTYSHVAVTDLPLAAFYSAALLLAMPWAAHGKRNAGLTASAACLGLAVLAKGLVPLVLFIPVFAFGWRRLAAWLRPGPILAFSICALPWYLLCTIRNGAEFPRIFFLEHHFQRFTTSDLQHVQPLWFYIPILLALLYPWFPLLFFPTKGFPNLFRDRQVKLLGAVIAFGVIFFSVSVNKLPGYLLPLMPAACIVLGLQLSRAGHPERAIIAPITLLGALPFLGRVGPPALAYGLRSPQVPWPWQGGLICMTAAAILATIVALALPGKAVEIAGGIAAFVLLWFQFAAFPLFDTAASVRPSWIAFKPPCAPAPARSRAYGLYYYAGRRLPDCGTVDPGRIPVVR